MQVLELHAPHDCMPAIEPCAQQDCMQVLDTRVPHYCMQVLEPLHRTTVCRLWSCVQVLLDFLGFHADGPIINRKHHKWKVHLMQLTYRTVQPSDVAHRRVLLLPVLIMEMTAATFSGRKLCAQYKWPGKDQSSYQRQKEKK